MPQTTFLERKARVLGDRVSAVKRQERRRPTRLIGVAVVLVAMVACFFVLKGVTLAHYGADGFARITAPVTGGGGMTGLRYWLGGIDPVTATVARALDPSLSLPLPAGQPGN